MKQLLDPEYRKLCDVLLNRNCKLVLEYLYECQFYERDVDFRTLQIPDLPGCLALLATLGFITKR